MTHTTGPWKFYNAYGSKQIMFTRLGNDQETIIVAARCGVECVLGNEDDAYLISAAPDLLEALQKIVNNWDNLHPKDRQQARAAISKAKGLVEREEDFDVRS